MDRNIIITDEVWKVSDFSDEFFISSYGRFKKKNHKNGYRFLKPYRHGNLFIIKVFNKEKNCARLVANTFIKKLNKKDIVYHINNREFDNRLCNLRVITSRELGEMTGHKSSRCKPVVEIKNNDIVRRWSSARKACKDLFISRETVCGYCNGKVKKKMVNIMWEDDYFENL